MESIELRFPSGLVISDALGMLQEKFRQYPWERYDGGRPEAADSICDEDVTRANRLGARTSHESWKQLIAEHGDELRGHLRGIPDQPLEMVSLKQIEPAVVGLFESVLTTQGIKLAGATKVLSPFRPALLPVVDSVVDYYYWYATSIRSDRRFRCLQQASWGGYVFALLELMQDDVRGCQRDLDRLIAAVQDQPYAAISRVRIVESLIWFYYARAGRMAADEERP